MVATGLLTMGDESLLEETLSSGIARRLDEALGGAKLYGTTSLPIWFDCKPTAAKQACQGCGAPLVKGEPRACLIDGVFWSGGRAGTLLDWFHLACFFALLSIKLEEFKREFSERLVAAGYDD